MLARQLETSVIKAMGNEHIVPKSYRFTIGLPTVNHAREMSRHLTHAMAFYPSDEQRLWERKRHLIEANACCDDLINDLQLIRTLNIGQIKQVAGLCETVDEEKRKIERALTNAHLVGHAKK